MWELHMRAMCLKEFRNKNCSSWQSHLRGICLDRIRILKYMFCLSELPPVVIFLNEKPMIQLQYYITILLFKSFQAYATFDSGRAYNSTAFGTPSLSWKKGFNEENREVPMVPTLIELTAWGRNLFIFFSNLQGFSRILINRKVHLDTEYNPSSALTSQTQPWRHLNKVKQFLLLNTIIIVLLFLFAFIYNPVSLPVYLSIAREVQVILSYFEVLGLLPGTKETPHFEIWPLQILDPSCCVK